MPLQSGTRFTHVALKNWRNFSAASVDLQKRVFLIGPNALGKSNFLDVFRYLHDIVAVGGGFQEAVRKRQGVSSLRCYAARRYPDISIAVSMGTDADPQFWRYELEFNQDNNQRAYLKGERVFRQQEQILSRPNTKIHRTRNV